MWEYRRHKNIVFSTIVGDKISITISKHSLSLVRRMQSQIFWLLYLFWGLVTWTNFRLTINLVGLHLATATVLKNIKLALWVDVGIREVFCSKANFLLSLKNEGEKFTLDMKHTALEQRRVHIKDTQTESDTVGALFWWILRSSCNELVIFDEV